MYYFQLRFLSINLTFKKIKFELRCGDVTVKVFLHSYKTIFDIKTVHFKQLPKMTFQVQGTGTHGSVLFSS